MARSGNFEIRPVRVFGQSARECDWPAAQHSNTASLLRHGYIRAEFGDTKTMTRFIVSPVASSPPRPRRLREGPQSTASMTGLADISVTAATTRCTTRGHLENHLQQESEWEVRLWGKSATSSAWKIFWLMAKRDLVRFTIRASITSTRCAPFEPALAFPGAVFAEACLEVLQREHYGQDRRSHD